MGQVGSSYGTRNSEPLLLFGLVGDLANLFTQPCEHATLGDIYRPDADANIHGHSSGQRLTHTCRLPTCLNKT